MAKGILIDKNDLRKAIEANAHYLEKACNIEHFSDLMYSKLNEACAQKFKKPLAPKWIAGRVSSKDLGVKIKCLGCDEWFYKSAGILAVKRVSCEHCLAEMVVDYNNLKIKKIEE